MPKAIIFVKWKGTFRFYQTKWSDRSKWTTFMAGSESSGLNKPKWPIPFDVPTAISGVLDWMESALVFYGQIIGKVIVGWCGVIELGLRLELSISFHDFFLSKCRAWIFFLYFRNNPGNWQENFFLDYSAWLAKFFHSVCSYVNICWYFLITLLTIPH